MISVIVPVYNAEKYLHRCLDSIINQSYKDIEVFLVNDGSTDDSGKICDFYVLNHRKINVIHKENSGPSESRNIGIRNSNGEFIFFIDSDDFLEKDALQLLIASYEEHDADIIIGDFNKIVDNKIVNSGHQRVFSTNKLMTKQDIINYTRNYLKAPNKFPLLAQSWGRLFKTSIIKKNNIFFDSTLHTFEDVAFNFVYLKYVNKIFFLNKTLYNFLIHTDHLSTTMKFSNDPNSLFGYQKALLRAREYLDNFCHNSCITKEIGQAYVRYTIIQLIRLCLQVNSCNIKQIYKFVCKVVNNPRLREGLRFYFPLEGESKILPILVKFKFVWLIIIVCRYRAKQRYKINFQN